jgi:hypothetical protein
MGKRKASSSPGGFDMSIDTSKVTSVRMVIFQPRVSYEPEEWSCDLETLKQFAKKAKQAVGECEQAAKEHQGLQSYQQAQKWAKKHLNPSEKACMWCKAKSSCPAIANECLQGVLVESAPTSDGLEDLDNAICVTVPDDAGLKQAIANVATLDFATVAKVYTNKKLFADWLDAVESRMLTDMLDGATADEWKLVQGRGGNRRWSDEDEAASVMKKSKLKVDEIYEKKLISVAAAEKLLKKSPDKWEKLQQFVTKSEGGLTVAKSSDKRQAVIRQEEALIGLECLDEPIEINDLI